MNNDLSRNCLLCGNEYTVNAKRYKDALCPECKTDRLEYALVSWRTQVKRAEDNGLEASLTFPEWIEILNHFHWNCAYCGGKYRVMEHKIPIKLGGGTTKDNCIPACQSCNVKQSRRQSPISFRPSYKTARMLGILQQDQSATKTEIIESAIQNLYQITTKSRISVDVSQETRKQADELIAKCGYSLRDVVTLGIEGLYQAKIEKEANMDYETKARKRVKATPELAKFEHVIFYDWPNWDEHMEWIATAPIAEIVDWAEAVDK